MSHGAALGLVLLVGLVGCQAGAGRAPAVAAGRPAESAAGAEAQIGLKIERFPGRPALVVLPREGDGRAAVALAVASDQGLVANTAVAALYESRLAQRGLRVEVSADREGVRATVLVAGGSAVEGATQALLGALRGPFEARDAAALKLIGARVAALRADVLDSVHLEPLAACTGEARLSAAERLPEASSLDGARVEAWRGALGASPAALGVAGPGGWVQQVEKILREAPEVAPRALAAPVVAEQQAAAVYVEPSRSKGSARVTVAVQYPRASEGVVLPERLSASLARRLEALPQPFRGVRVVGVARRDGSCVSVSAEGGEGRWPTLEEDSAQAAALIRQELLATVAVEDEGQVVRLLQAPGDPRDAAAAVAWWALAGAGGKQRVAVALGVGAKGLHDEKEPSPGADAKVFEAAYRGMVAAQERPVVEARVATEPGQGQAWVMLASACPVTESEADAGATALLVSLAARQAARRGLRVEPWVGPDGAGLIGRMPVDAQRWRVQTEQMAEALAEGLLAAPPGAEALAEVRGQFLSWFEQSAAPRERLWELLSPGQPGRMAPWGTAAGAARVSHEALRLRWRSLAGGPLRVALLANRDVEQGAVVTRSVDRWVTRGSRPRVCPAVAPAPAAQAGVQALPGGSRAYVAVRVDASGAGGAAAECAVAALSGVLEQELGGTGVQGEAWLAGHGAESALVVELRGAEGALEGAIGKVKPLVSTRLAERVDEGAWGRVAERWARMEEDRSVDPRWRLVGVWRGRTRVEAPTAEAWRGWVRGQLVREPLIARPPPPG